MTSHRHGGSAHTHVLPRPGVDIARRELVVMGLAGGLLPSPSAVLVLLAAVTLGRVWLGLGLVIAYGVGLALTLIAAGLLMAVLEARFRQLSIVTTNGRVAAAIRVLPFASAAVLIGGGLLVAVRALSELAL